MPSPPTLVRIMVGIALGFAMAAFVALPTPQHLPAIALDQTGLYRLEVALAVFYGCLLILTPAYSGLALGRLPIEISTRGAKFAAEADRADERDEATIARLERGIAELKLGLSDAQAEIDLQGRGRGDKT